MSDDIIEPARTGRAKCRRCGEPLNKGELRFGESVPNAFGEGEARHWFHLGCAAEKRPDKLARALEAYPAEVPDRGALRTAAASGVDNPRLVEIRRAERAPSGRARCQECREIIAKGELRVAVEREDEMPVAQVSYVHAACAAKRFGTRGLIDKLRRTSPELEPQDFEAFAAAPETHAAQT
jgi:hypothetical protein